MRIYRLLFAGLAGIVLLTGPLTLDATTRGTAGTSVSGGGTYNVLDDTLGGSWRDAGQFSINAGLRPDGSSYGQISFVGRGDFAAAWGACPFDPRCEDFPNTFTFIFQLTGPVSSVNTAGDTVTLTGELVETDHGKGDGEIFEAGNEPFSITLTEGSDQFVFQFCALPPFTMEVAKGTLNVNAGLTPTALLRAPAQARAKPSALPCHSPSAK